VVYLRVWLSLTVALFVVQGLHDAKTGTQLWRYVKKYPEGPR
jgi:hypothetical protein